MNKKVVLFVVLCYVLEMSVKCYNFEFLIFYDYWEMRFLVYLVGFDVNGRIWMWMWIYKEKYLIILLDIGI